MNQAKPRSRWGLGVAVLYGGFVLFILVCVGYASLQHFDLVEPHYYDRTLVYQEQIDKLHRTAALTEQPELTFDIASRALIVRFPAYGQIVEGTVTFYRPSGAGMDFSRPLTLDSSSNQVVQDSRLIAGFWRLKLDWRMADQNYYLEQDILIP